MLLNAMHDEIVTVRKAAGVGGVERQVNGGLEQEENAAAGDWKTTTNKGRVLKPSVSATTATGLDHSPVSAGFRGLSHSSIKVAGHASPPPTEQPFFTLQLDVASPLNKNLDDAVRAITKEEQLEGYKLKSGDVVTV